MSLFKLTSRRTQKSRNVTQREIDTMREGYKRNNLGVFDDLFIVEPLEEIEEEQKEAPQVAKPRRKRSAKKEE